MYLFILVPLQPLGVQLYTNSSLRLSAESPAQNALDRTMGKNSNFEVTDGPRVILCGIVPFFKLNLSDAAVCELSCHRSRVNYDRRADRLRANFKRVSAFKRATFCACLVRYELLVRTWFRLKTDEMRRYLWRRSL